MNAGIRSSRGVVRLAFAITVTLASFSVTASAQTDSTPPSVSITAPAAVWQRLNFSWVLFFFFLGGANLYVAFHFAEETWVKFKLFGMLGLTLVFVVAQSFYLARHARDVHETTSTPH